MAGKYDTRRCSIPTCCGPPPSKHEFADVVFAQFQSHLGADPANAPITCSDSLPSSQRGGSAGPRGRLRNDRSAARASTRRRSSATGVRVDREASRNVRAHGAEIRRSKKISGNLRVRNSTSIRRMQLAEILFDKMGLQRSAAGAARPNRVPPPRTCSKNSAPSCTSCRAKVIEYREMPN